MTPFCPRIHDLAALYNRLNPKLSEIDIEMLEELSDVYTDVRYPADIGYLPQGAPLTKDIERFSKFAQTTYVQVRAALGIADS